MAYTQFQLDSLTKAIAEGALRVRYEDRDVIFRSLADMTSLKVAMERELGIIGKGPSRTRIACRKDLGPAGSGPSSGFQDSFIPL